MHDDTADETGVVELPGDVDSPVDAKPRPVIIHALEDVGYYDADGIRKERVKVTLTLPTA